MKEVLKTAQWVLLSQNVPNTDDPAAADFYMVLFYHLCFSVISELPNQCNRTSSMLFDGFSFRDYFYDFTTLESNL